jgi:hypothetical protein
MGLVGYAYYTFKKIKEDEEELQLEKEEMEGTWVWKEGGSSQLTLGKQKVDKEFERHEAMCNYMDSNAKHNNSVRKPHHGQSKSKRKKVSRKALEV